MKHYVLDTSVLLHSPNALFAFNEHVVVLPEVVLEELDHFKSESSDRGVNSRQVSRIIDSLLAAGNLLDGVPINDHGGILKIETTHLSTRMPEYWDHSRADNRILQVCKGLSEINRNVILVSRDTNMRVKAAILNIQAEDFRNDKVPDVEEQYSGRAVVYASSAVINAFHGDDAGHIDPAGLYTFDERSNTLLPVSLSVNEFVLICSTDNDQHKALGRFDGRSVVHLRYHKRSPFGVVPRNVGQIFMQECLMMSAEEAPLVIIKGLSLLVVFCKKIFINIHMGLHQRLINMNTVVGINVSI